MFAPKIAKTQPQATVSSTNSLARQRVPLRGRRSGHGLVEQARALQRTIGNQATLRLLAQRAGSLTGDERSHQGKQEMEGSVQEASATSRGFAHPPDIAGSQAPAPLYVLPPPVALQPKLVVGAIDDPLEHEADYVANQIMRMPAPGQSTSIPPPHISPKDAAREGEAAQILRTDPAGRMPDTSGSEAAGRVGEVLQSPGQPLDARTRAFFEPRFGQDFSPVRVHADEAGAKSAQAVHAFAYTAGAHIAFAPDRYAPDTWTGQHLLAHELAHVVQQRGGPSAVGPPPGSVSLQRQSTTPTVQTSAGLGPKQTQDTDDMIKAGNFQGAVDMVVFYAGGGFNKNYSIDATLLENEQMFFDPSVTWADASTAMPSWDFINNKADPAKVRIGPSAFSSVAYLYSVIMHEYQHVLFRQSLSNQQISHQASGHGGMDTDEVEASAWELLHATDTGLSRLPDKIALVWSTLNSEFWQLDPAAQATARPLVTRALNEATRFVKGSQVTLDPFSP